MADGEAPRDAALEHLGEAGGPATTRVVIDGVKVDVMATEPLPAAEADRPDGPTERLFVLGHRWALETAAPVSVQVVDGNGVLAEAGDLRVATVPALVACKLHALTDRRASSGEKRESDALDVMRLVELMVQNVGMVDELRGGPFDLAELVSDHVARWLVDDALRTVRLVNAGSGPALPRVEVDDVSTLGTLFVDAVRQP